jgi:hypothetical protein
MSLQASSGAPKHCIYTIIQAICMTAFIINLHVPIGNRDKPGKQRQYVCRSLRPKLQIKLTYSKIYHSILQLHRCWLYIYLWVNSSIQTMVQSDTLVQYLMQSIRCLQCKECKDLCYTFSISVQWDVTRRFMIIIVFDSIWVLNVAVR